MKAVDKADLSDEAIDATDANKAKSNDADKDYEAKATEANKAGKANLYDKAMYATEADEAEATEANEADEVKANTPISPLRLMWPISPARLRPTRLMRPKPMKLTRPLMQIWPTKLSRCCLTMTPPPSFTFHSPSQNTICSSQKLNGILSLMDVIISLWQLSACVIVNMVGGERAPSEFEK